MPGNEVDEVIKRVMAIENVTRYVVFNKDGIVLRYEGWPSEEGDGGYRKCVQLAGTVANLVNHCSQGCQDMLAPPNNEVECLRLKTRNYEMIVAPGANFTMVAIQEPLKAN
ncbi:Dynein light chain roadblock-type 1 [Hondaea fermentalgiana]|uniref:Dynein light chain roadblock-type 1 n=1 Tax=Hondaea fermentalgiana TaxID=2315210 RepID=A0A2R5GKG6_9STRA|nr:Dynein light chain roadblock-type 1 [Hondaea fermentalgiana]|eukprot:GBG30809.1 Dynein light chain roadblock-type 1 [Hondaea fermentalgiana]